MPDERLHDSRHPDRLGDRPYGVNCDPVWRSEGIDHATGSRCCAAHALGVVTNDDRAGWRGPGPSTRAAQSHSLHAAPRSGHEARLSHMPVSARIVSVMPEPISTT